MSRHRQHEKTFVQHTSGTKKYPNSLRKLMRLVREKLFNVDDETFATELNKHGNMYATDRASMTGEKVKNLESNRTAATYVVLERYAETVGLSTGLFLLFSRLRSFEEKSQASRAEAMINAIREITNGINNKTSFDVDELRRWSKIHEKYDGSFKDGQLTLLPPGSTRRKT